MIEVATPVHRGSELCAELKYVAHFTQANRHTDLVARKLLYARKCFVQLFLSANVSDTYICPE
jgi:hypothetical protein